MSIPRSILFATSNPHKLDEVGAITAELGVVVEGLDDRFRGLRVPHPTSSRDVPIAGPRARSHTPADWGVAPGDQFRGLPEPVEDSPTFTGNALIKARYYAEHLGRAVLADDSGLVVDAIGGEPGVRSARYAGVSGPRAVVDPANNRKLLDALADVPDERRTARFVCVLALCDAERTIALVRGTVEGSIAHAERGTNGFGYDPLFVVHGLGCTSAELPPEKKNAISHRGRAVRRLIELLRAGDA